MKYIVASLAISLLALTVGKVNVIASSVAGLHIEFSDIKDTFNRHLVKYIGECPDEFWSGLAEDGDLRFISHNTEPNKKLKVSLTNLRTGKRINRDYKKPSLGSNDFNLTQLGNSNGSHEIEYAIYNKDTKERLETGSFTYNITSSQETREIMANWKLELYCIDDYDHKKKLNECKTIGSRQVKYCRGQRTSDIRDRGIVNLDRDRVYIDINIR